MTDAQSVRGTWISLQPMTALNWPETSRLDELRQWHPNLGGTPPRRDAAGSFGPAMLIRDNRSAEAIGTVENSEMAGYPGVAVVLIYVNALAARPGLALEAFALYVANVFQNGARLVHLEVLEFNRPVHRMVARLGIGEQARMREQVYVAGRFWDLVVYAFDREHFDKIWKRYARSLPGGPRPPAALGGGRMP